MTKAVSHAVVRAVAHAVAHAVAYTVANAVSHAEVLGLYLREQLVTHAIHFKFQSLPESYWSFARRCTQSHTALAFLLCIDE